MDEVGAYQAQTTYPVLTVRSGPTKTSRDWIPPSLTNLLSHLGCSRTVRELGAALIYARFIQRASECRYAAFYETL